jgi:Tfp pilus assembly pilus retraction ATPase PilT
MNETGASDLHLASGSQPILRVRGEMERVIPAIRENDDLKSMLMRLRQNCVKVSEKSAMSISAMTELPVPREFLQSEVRGCRGLPDQSPAVLTRNSQAA